MLPIQSPLARQFNKTVNTERLAEIANTDKEEYQAHLTDIQCFIHPGDEAFNEGLDGSFGKEFIMFCEIIDIKEGDRVIDGSTEYRVVGLENFSEFIDRAMHLEVILRKFND